MSSDYYALIAGDLADAGAERWPCCEHCDHDPGYEHADPCLVCDLEMEGLS